VIYKCWIDKDTYETFECEDTPSINCIEILDNDIFNKLVYLRELKLYNIINNYINNGIIPEEICILKEKIIKLINIYIEKLIEETLIEFDSHYFSLSSKDQQNWQGLWSLANTYTNNEILKQLGIISENSIGLEHDISTVENGSYRISIENIPTFINLIVFKKDEIMSKKRALKILVRDSESLTYLQNFDVDTKYNNLG
jgi:hypothetical protein